MVARGLERKAESFSVTATGIDPKKPGNFKNEGMLTMPNMIERSHKIQ